MIMDHYDCFRGGWGQYKWLGLFISWLYLRVLVYKRLSTILKILLTQRVNTISMVSIFVVSFVLVTIQTQFAIVRHFGGWLIFDFVLTQWCWNFAILFFQISGDAFFFTIQWRHIRPLVGFEIFYYILSKISNYKFQFFSFLLRDPWTY